MNTKQLTLTIILAISFGLGATFIYSQINNSHNSQTPKPTPTIAAGTPTNKPPEFLTWQDPAGFTFQYPATVTINNHPEDNINYSHLTLKYPDNTITEISMSDSTLKNISNSNATLDSKPAKIITTNGMTTLTCIYNNVLVTIFGTNITPITDSWAFVYPTPTTGSAKTASPSTSGDILEEE